jgi:DnaJ domain.
VFPEWISSFPSWLVVGVFAGGCATVIIAGVFMIGGRLFPDDESGSGTGATRGKFNRRRGEFRSYFRVIEEPFIEDYEVAGETVEFYLSDHDVGITFDAQVYFVLDRTGIDTVLCEYEMPVRALGRRLPFEIPDLDPPSETGDTSQNSSVIAAYDKLGLPTTADTKAVRDAYREQVKTAHPDHGGTQIEFTQLQEAYTTARNHAEDTSHETVPRSN